jgi:hypothetical protein
VLTARDAAVFRVNGSLGTDAAQVVAVLFQAFAAGIVRVVETPDDRLTADTEHRTQEPRPKP